MKKFFNYLLLALVTVCFALPLGGKAEAAKVAVVPLANHVAGDELAGTIYMQEAWHCSVIRNLIFWVRMWCWKLSAVKTVLLITAKPL